MGDDSSCKIKSKICGFIYEKLELENSFSMNYADIWLRIGQNTGVSVEQVCVERVHVQKSVEIV